MCLKIFSIVGLLLAYQKMANNETSPKKIRFLRQDEALKTGNSSTYDAKTKNMIGNSPILSTTNKECSQTCKITCQFNAVSLQHKRKLNSREVHSDSSPKTVKNEQRGKKDITEGERSHVTAAAIENRHFETGLNTKNWNLLFRVSKKDKDGDTALHLSIIHHDVEKSKSLIKIMTGKPLDIVNKLQQRVIYNLLYMDRDKHQTPLHLSVLTCQPTLVKFLIFHGASVNMRDRNGQTPLHLASKNADSDCVKAIKDASELPKYFHHTSAVDEKPDLKLKNFEGQAAFHLAVLSGSEEIVKILLEMKANINIQDGKCGRTALHLAVESHNINMINFLLKNGADVNATTFSGNTALHMASGLCMEQIIQLLIRNGADINIKNIEGDSPLYIKIEKSMQWKRPSKPRRETTHQKNKQQSLQLNRQLSPHLPVNFCLKNK